MPLTYSARLGPIDRLKDNLAFHVRRQIFRLFMQEFELGPDDQVADFGVSGYRNHPVHYFFEALFPYRENLTVIGRAAEDAQWFPEQFPGLTFLEADLRAIPLPDNYFSAGICNAVVEHAGSRSDQAMLVAEVCRVSRRVLFTTPNKSFPVELHTFLPFVHWLPDRIFRRILRFIGLDALADVDVLNPLDAAAFAALFPPDRRPRIQALGLPLLKTNLIAVSVSMADREQGVRPSATEQLTQGAVP